jgi:transcriptional regulator with XRE-family HTH domain
MFISDLQSSPSSTARQFWANIFARGIRQARQACGMSVEQAAQLAGMEASEWAVIEAGYVPDPTQLRPMADALELGYDKIATLAMLCRDAWE